jgi:hypothetical protein
MGRMRVRLGAESARLRYVARYRFSLYPALYLPWARRHYAGTGIEVVGPDTELVIEGFGRSGSTFAVDAFELAQPGRVRIAHHTHAAAQVVEAARRGIPALVIVRHPDDATLSHMARRGIPAVTALRSWIRYHERVAPWKERLLLVPFEDVTRDFGTVIRRLNERFGTEYGVFEHSKENEARVFEIIDSRNRERFDAAQPERARSLARPTREREALKTSFRDELEAPRLRALRTRAAELYRSLVTISD